MNTFSDEQDIAAIVASVAALFVQLPDAQDGEIVEAAVARGIDRLDAELAVAFVPCAFGRALIRENQWNAQLPDEFRAEDQRGRYVPFRLSGNLTYRSAEDLAEHQRIAHRPVFGAIASRSAELHAISNAFSAGSDVRDGIFSPVFLPRISAEDMARRKVRWWHRVRTAGRLTSR